MDKQQLIDKVKSGNYTKEQILGWVSSLPSTYNNSRKPSEYKVGDVFMHPIFQHPYILLNFKNGMWICGLITSESNCPEILEQCDSRFFRESSYFTKTIFTASEVIGSFVNPFENRKQIKEVLNKLKIIFK